ncbi:MULTISPECIES: methyl-accepting chemotaxis protein [Roseateles]|uniref:Methyl-accepting chemotaxis protein n=1 Tax=Pelomonas caseinilytica TaxID=2906763 RepID=A0ABS8XFA0_9BURK|nr:MULTISPECIES: methyl-accepting chemotaxis protein [unclassified Roseateles]MCE4539574.1 methyl-accepting chemotaxis protein [Pelomonas sp. P7]HEV6967484.1 methyl-accepting chemotaxis protein [Roseateles sp.]
MFANLSIAQRLALYLGLSVALQLYVIGGVLYGMPAGWLIGGSLLLGSAIAFVYLDGAKSVGVFLRDLLSGAHRMSAGDLREDIVLRGNSSAREGMSALVRLQDTLRSMMGTLRDGAEQVNTAASEIAAGNLDLSQRTERGSADLQQAASSMRQMTEAARHSSEAMGEASALAETTRQHARHSGEVVLNAVTAMNGVSQSSRKIADIIGVIDGIAFQTNILALNAAVEAARAGEQGRGFAVVAGEVRQLAQRSAEAAKEIKSLIGASVEQVDAGSRLVNEAGTQMQEVVSSVERVAALIKDATELARTQSAGLREIADSVDRLDQSMQQNAALVEEGAAAAESLKAQSHRLNELVGRFRTR